MRRYVLAALLIHAAIALVVSRQKPRAPLPPPTSLPHDEIALEPDLPIPTPIPIPAPIPVPEASGTTSSSATTTPAPVAASKSAVDPPVEPPEAAPATEAPISILSSPTGPDLGFGVGALNPFLPRSEAQVELAEQKRILKRTMDDPAHARDVSLGLTPEGPVLTALAESTMRSLAPVYGKATFRVVADGEGNVVSIELQESVGDRGGWADAGHLALEALQIKKLRVPSTSTRTVMRILVDSEAVLPSGHTPGVDVSLFHIPLTKSGTPRPTKVGILEPKLNVHHLELAPGVKIPIVSFSLNLIRSDFDPADIGAVARRVIHTRTLESTSM